MHMSMYVRASANLYVDVFVVLFVVVVVVVYVVASVFKGEYEKKSAAVTGGAYYLLAREIIHEESHLSLDVRGRYFAFRVHSRATAVTRPCHGR